MHGDRLRRINENEAGQTPTPGRKPRKWDFHTQEEVDQVLESCKGTRMHALMMLGFQTGMRPGEITALQWEDVRFGQQVVFVTRYLKGGERSSSRRGIPISDDLVAALKARKETYDTSPWVVHAGGRRGARQRCAELPHGRGVQGCRVPPLHGGPELLRCHAIRCHPSRY